MAPNSGRFGFIQDIGRRDIAIFVHDAFFNDTERTIIEYLQRNDWDVGEATEALSQRPESLGEQQAESSKTQEKLQQQKHSSAAASGTSKLASHPAATSASNPSTAHDAISIASDDDDATDLYGVSDEERERQKAAKKNQSGKRPASSEDLLQSPPKKSKTDEYEDGDGIGKGKGKQMEEDEDDSDEFEREEKEDDSASDWVENAIGRLNLKEGIIVALDSGDHPVVFTRNFLRKHFDFFERRIRPSPPELLETIEVPFVDRVTFDILIQWVAVAAQEGVIVLTEARARTASIEIDSFIQLALAAKVLGPKRSSDLLDTNIANCIRNILREDRNWLKDYHIERVCGSFKRDHPVRRAIIDALVVPYAKCRGDLEVAATRRPYLDASSEQKYYAQILDTLGLEAELNELVMIAIRGRQKWDTTIRSPTELQDPLFDDGDRAGQFVLNVDPHTSKST